MSDVDTRIRNLPPELRPRERLLSVGEEGLDDVGLLALVLGTGTRGRSAIDLARDLLLAAGGLRALASWTPRQIALHAGVGEARGARVGAALALGKRIDAALWMPGVRLNDCREVIRHYRSVLRGRSQEVLVAVLLDARHRLIRDAVVAMGGLTDCVVEPRAVFGLALREGAAGVVVVHNHPSGEVDPSADDVILTRRLEEAGIVLGVPLLDHVIVAESGGYSFAEKGLLRFAKGQNSTSDEQGRQKFE